MKIPPPKKGNIFLTTPLSHCYLFLVEQIKSLENLPRSSKIVFELHLHLGRRHSPRYSLYNTLAGTVLPAGVGAL